MEKSRGGAKIKEGEIRGFAPRGAKIRWTKNEWSENLREAKFEKNKVITQPILNSNHCVRVRLDYKNRLKVCFATHSWVRACF